jgi:hypothetical protein
MASEPMGPYRFLQFPGGIAESCLFWLLQAFEATNHPSEINGSDDSDFADWLHSGRQVSGDFLRHVLEIRQRMRQCEAMTHAHSTSTVTPGICLIHQQVETRTSPAGLVCPCCKQALYLQTAGGEVRSYWESQPGAYTLEKHPIFIRVRQVGQVKIRSLCPE